MMVWKMYILLILSIFGIYVKFLGVYIYGIFWGGFVII